MIVRAKFRCTTKEPAINEQGCGKIVLDPVHSGSPENEQFYKWTPWGQIVLGTVNSAAFDKFEVGREFYVDFTLAESA